MNHNISIPEELYRTLIGKELECYQVEGDCLAGKKVQDQGYLLFDVEAKPIMGDITMCITSSGQVLAKMFIAQALNFKEQYIVRTWHKDPARDISIRVPYVRGVAVASIDPAGELVWSKSYKNAA